MNVQREVGGNLAVILDTIAATIRERQELQGEVRTLTAQGRISAYIISGLPVALGGALLLLNPKYISTLWTTTIGYFMLGVAVTMIVVGFFVTRKVAVGGGVKHVAASTLIDSPEAVLRSSSWACQLARTWMP